MRLLSKIYKTEKKNKHTRVYLFGIKIFKYKNKKQNHHKNYNNILKKIKKQKDPIKVIFLVSENQKWQYQDLYDCFEKDKRFQPLVLISLLTAVHEGIDKTRNNLEENYNFFKSRGMNVEYCYQNGEYLSLKNFNPNIVFYEQPWDLPYIYMPENVSAYALTFYENYFYLGMFERDIDDVMTDFHKSLFRFFIPNDEIMDLMVKRHEYFKKICVSIGYSKLDKFTESIISKNKVGKNAKKVIYAPHHSFEQEGDKLATFQNNGRQILELAQKYPEITWIFKPHPRFKHAVLSNKIMSEKEIEEYYNAWEKIGVVYTQGDYIDIFKSSDLMITDCCSFLAEYLVTEKPLIRLCNKGGRSFTEFGETITSGYYAISDYENLENVFNQIISGEDSKKEYRQTLVKKVMDKKEKASMKIHKYISNLIFS